MAASGTLTTSLEPRHVTRLACAVTFFTQVGVLGCELMAPLAVSLPGVDGRWGRTAQGVGSSGHRFEMLGITAKGSPTEMVNSQTVRDGSHQPLVDDAMGQEDWSSPTPYLDDAIPMRTDGASPEPTGRRDGYAGPESFFGGGSGLPGISPPLQSSMVELTEPIGLHGAGTPLNTAYALGHRTSLGFGRGRGRRKRRPAFLTSLGDSL